MAQQTEHNETPLEKFQRLDAEISVEVQAFANREGFPVGTAKKAKEIIDGKLYLALREDDGTSVYTSLQSYLYDTGMTWKKKPLRRKNVYKLAAEFGVYAEVAGKGSVDPTTRAQLQALKRLDAEWRPKIWLKSIENASGAEITDKIICEAAGSEGQKIAPRGPSATEKLGRLRTIMAKLLPGMRVALAPRFDTEIAQIDHILFPKEGKEQNDGEQNTKIPPSPGIVAPVKPSESADSGLQPTLPVPSPAIPQTRQPGIQCDGKPSATPTCTPKGMPAGIAEPPATPDSVENTGAGKLPGESKVVEKPIADNPAGSPSEGSTPPGKTPETDKNVGGGKEFALTASGYPLPILYVTNTEIVVRFKNNKHYGDYFRCGVVLQMFGLVPSADYSTWIRKEPPASIGPEIATKIEAANQKIVAERRDGKGL
jgi:hypothetical protein